MGDVSEHFNRKNFECRCGQCGFDAVDVELLGHLEDARHYFNAPIIINDACRCVIHNASVGGSIHSQHLLGKAADIQITTVHPNAVADYFEMLFPDKYGIGRYPTAGFTHFDVRDIKARWTIK